MEKNHLKKYRLKKLYPGSPELDTIVTYYSNWGMYGITNECIFKKQDIENNSEYWEEIKEELPVGTKIVDTDPETKGYTYTKLENGKWKIGSQDYFTIPESSIGKGKRFQIVEEFKQEYEILSFRTNRKTGCIPEYTVLEKEKDEIFRNHKACSLTISSSEEELENNSNYNIFSIKRLRDGEIFQIGDKIKGDKVSTIKSFEISNLSKSKIIVHAESEITKDYTNCCLSYINHVKPIFTTEDGINIREGDDVWITWNYKFGEPIYPEIFKLNWKLFNKQAYDNKYFSTKETAENYIILNKPCLSINEILSVGQRIIVDEGKLKQLVKIKIDI